VPVQGCTLPFNAIRVCVASDTETSFLTNGQCNVLKNSVIQYTWIFNL